MSDQPRSVERANAFLGSIVLAAVLLASGTSAWALDETRYPDWKGRWLRVSSGNYDPTKPPGLPQKPPLTPEYQAVFEASVADQAAGGQGNNPMAGCMPPGMPRMMILYGLGVEILVTPSTTYMVFGEPMGQLRRIYTDGRDFPKNDEPSYMGYSIGKWIDENQDGKYDVLEVETRNFKGPRTYENSGILLHQDNQSIIKERFYLDKANPDVLHIEITSTDHALTRPWTVVKTFRREQNVQWAEYDCAESNNHVAIGKEYYFLSADGYLMPTRKDQPPPDPRYFKTGK